MPKYFHFAYTYDLPANCQGDTARNPEQMFENWKLGFPIGSVYPPCNEHSKSKNIFVDQGKWKNNNKHQQERPLKLVLLPKTLICLLLFNQCSRIHRFDNITYCFLPKKCIFDG